MRQTTDETKLAATLPDGVAIAHKTGTLPSDDGAEGVEHDVGIVSTDQGQYIIVAMSKDLPDNAAARSAIGEVSQLVYAWFTGNGE
jgi:beta-lactamase class A